MRQVENIIEALGRHEDDSSVSVLENVGTNSQNDEVRASTARALVRRNSEDSLRVVLLSEGKGINDLSTRVFETAVSSLLELDDKSRAIRILDDTIAEHSVESVRHRASQVRFLLSASN